MKRRLPPACPVLCMMASAPLPSAEISSLFFLPLQFLTILQDPVSYVHLLEAFQATHTGGL